MISDLLAILSMLDAETDDALEHEPAIKTVVESVEREVSDAERAELRDLLDAGWLDE